MTSERPNRRVGSVKAKKARVTGNRTDSDRPPGPIDVERSGGWMPPRTCATQYWLPCLQGPMLPSIFKESITWMRARCRFCWHLMRNNISAFTSFN